MCCLRSSLNNSGWSVRRLGGSTSSPRTDASAIPFALSREAPSSEAKGLSKGKVFIEHGFLTQDTRP